MRVHRWSQFRNALLLGFLAVFTGIQPAFAEKTMEPLSGYFVNQFTPDDGLTGFPYSSQGAVCSAINLPGGPWVPEIYDSCASTYGQLPEGLCRNQDLVNRGGAGKRYYCPKGWVLRNTPFTSGTVSSIRHVIDSVGCGLESQVYCALPDPVIDPPKNFGPPAPCSGDGAGNPMGVSTGNKCQQETDYQGEGPFPLEFRRRYNSLGGQATSYEIDVSGTGFPQHSMLWHHSYDRKIRYQPVTLLGNSFVRPNAFISRQDGRGLFFSFSNDAWNSDSDVTDKLEQITNAGGAI
ncbi:MAG: DUF6531 domain-containing protein [Actinomycetota bacterium]